MMLIDGWMGNRPEKVPGVEGAGVVVAVGRGAEQWQGRRVAVMDTDDGCFAEYKLTSTNKIYPLADHLSFEDGATLCVNPMTVCTINDDVLENFNVTGAV